MQGLIPMFPTDDAYEPLMWEGLVRNKQRMAEAHETLTRALHQLEDAWCVLRRPPVPCASFFETGRRPSPSVNSSDGIA